MSTLVFYSRSTLCQILFMYRLLILCYYVHWCLLQSFHFLLVPQFLPSVFPGSLCPMLSSTVFPMSVSTSICTVFFYAALWPLLFPTVCPLHVCTSHCTVYWFCVTVSSNVFYSLSSVCQYLTFSLKFVLCHYVLWCLLQSLLCLSVPHIVS